MRILVLLLLLSGCGLFKKSKIMDRFSDKSKIEQSNDSLGFKIDTSRIETLENVEITFKIGESILKPVDGSIDVSGLLGQVEEIKLNLTRKTTEERGITEKIIKQNTKSENRDIEKKEVKKEKESDTSFWKNIPVWYIVIVIIVIAVLIYIFTGKSFIRVFSRKPP